MDDLPREGALDEIYYYEFDKPQGFGFQAVYTEEKDINEVYKVENGDFVVYSPLDGSICPTFFAGTPAIIE